MPRVAQRLRQCFGLGARAAIDDPRLALARGGEAQDLLPRALFHLEGERQVRPVEAAQEAFGRHPVEQPRDDLGLRLGIRRRGERGQRHVQRFAQGPDAQVVGAEIMAPLADAMRLVYRDQADAGALEHPLGARGRQPFRRDVEQPERAILERGPDGVGFLGRVAGGQRARDDARLAQAPHLVAHQRDQWRDHHGHALAHQRGQLEAQRLAAARRHDGQHVAPLRHRLHDLGLAGAEGRESEDRG